MCTYSISVDDTLMEQVRPAFADNDAVGVWMQSQIETLLFQMATEMQYSNVHKVKLSKRLRGIAHAPEGFDYKQELATRF